MSGTDSKAGGRDYLLLFMQAKTVSKKVDARSGDGRAGGE
jgi:1-pyrroline-5-carboxylate dehydrogenase